MCGVVAEDNETHYAELLPLDKSSSSESLARCSDSNPWSVTHSVCCYLLVFNKMFSVYHLQHCCTPTPDMPQFDWNVTEGISLITHWRKVLVVLDSLSCGFCRQNRFLVLHACWKRLRIVRQLLRREVACTASRLLLLSVSSNGFYTAGIPNACCRLWYTQWLLQSIW